MNAYLEANLAVLEELCDELIALLRRLDDDCVNWQPLAKDTNSIAVLVTHTTGSINSWLARALGETAARDRDAEFRAHATTRDLIGLVERARDDARRSLERLDTMDPAEKRPVRRLSRGEDATVSAAWCVEHAVIHAGEHWGQIQLTRQTYAAR